MKCTRTDIRIPPGTEPLPVGGTSGIPNCAPVARRVMQVRPPPVVMAGYSARLALKTTVVGLVFSVAASAPDWRYPTLVAVPMLCWAGFRLVRTAGLWAVPEVRSRVVAIVAT